jgi:hypothetical protein
VRAPLLWVELSVLADCAERRDRRVIRGSKQVSDELVPVTVGVEDEWDEVGAFLLSKECVLADLLVHGVGFRFVQAIALLKLPATVGVSKAAWA